MWGREKAIGVKITVIVVINIPARVPNFAVESEFSLRIRINQQ